MSGCFFKYKRIKKIIKQVEDLIYRQRYVSRRYKYTNKTEEVFKSVLSDLQRSLIVLSLIHLLVSDGIKEDAFHEQLEKELIKGGVK